MKKPLDFWQFIGFIAVSVGGTLLHFVYEWTSESILAAPFSGVNESTWEHIKLLFFPLFIFAIIESFLLKERRDFWCVKLIGTLAGLLLIPFLFYFYNGAFGKSPDWVNISIFFISAAAAFVIETILFKSERIACKKPFYAFLMLCLIGSAFIVFTFLTPQLPIFEDPLSGSYGI